MSFVPGTLRMDVVSRLIWIKEEEQTRPTVTAERMEHRHESQRHHDLPGGIGRAGQHRLGGRPHHAAGTSAVCP